jgi:uncharacterized membrane protein YbhN (UPF0104 family)
MGNLITTAAGAAWYVGSLRNEHNIPVTKSLLSLVLARLGDLLMLLLSLSTAALILWRQIGSLHVTVIVVIIALSSVASMSLLILILRQRFVRFFSNIWRRFNWRQETYVRRALTTLTEFAERGLAEAKLNSIGAFAGYSVFSCGTMFLFAYSSIQAFGVWIDVWPVIFVISLTQVMALVPIQIFGGLGLYDFTYLYLYGLLGFDRSEFAAVVVGLRVSFYVINLLLLALAGLPRPLLLRLSLRKQT